VMIVGVNVTDCFWYRLTTRVVKGVNRLLLLLLSSDVELVGRVGLIGSTLHKHRSSFVR